MSPGEQLVQALVAALDDHALDVLAQRLAPRLADHVAPVDRGGWLDARAAAEYLGLPSVDQLHKLTGERRLAFSQERPGAKCYFRREDLDAHREQHMRGGA